MTTDRQQDQQEQDSGGGISPLPFDRKRFAVVLDRAIGRPGRSINQFGRECDISGSYVSRFINELVKTPPSPGVLQKFAEHAANGVTYEELMIAAGYLSLTMDTTNIIANAMVSTALLTGDASLLPDEAKSEILEIGLLVASWMQKYNVSKSELKHNLELLAKVRETFSFKNAID